MSTRYRSLTRFLAVTLLLSLSACFGPNTDNGALFTFGVQDTPVDGVDSLVIDFTGVDLMGPDGVETFTFPGGWPIDLLDYQGGNTAILIHNLGIYIGDYQWIRLDIDPAKSYLIAADGNQYPLTFPSGSTTGLKVVSAFTVTQGESAHYVIDFDLRKSLTVSSGGGTPVYTLNPSLRLIHVSQTGFIKGTVASTLTVGVTPITTTGCYPAVYVYPDTPTTLGGFQASVSGGTEPLTSTSLMLDNTTGNYVYNFAYLPAGTYTLAVTCAGDDTAGATSLAFSTSQTATVTSNYISPVNF